MLQTDPGPSMKATKQSREARKGKSGRKRLLKAIASLFYQQMALTDKPDCLDSRLRPHRRFSTIRSHGTPHAQLPSGKLAASAWRSTSRLLQLAHAIAASFLETSHPGRGTYLACCPPPADHSFGELVSVLRSSMFVGFSPEMLLLCF